MNLSDLVVFLILLGFMASNIPVYICLYFTSALGLILFTSFPIELLTQTLFRSLDNFALVVVLFFILCGNTMSSGDIVNRLIRVANALVGWLPGGLGMAGVIGCALFGAISGSTVATVVAIGGVMIPALLKNGYDENYSLGIMATSPNLGVIIPPSISMILYSMISNVSLEGLFLTGFVPGIMIVIFTCIYTYFQFHNKSKSPNGTSLKNFSSEELISALKDGFWALLLPVIIFGGIFSGMFTANEAAVIASVYAFFVELFIHKAITFKEVKEITVSSAVTSATLLIIVAGATCFGRFLTLENIPFRISSLVMNVIHSPLLFLLVINIIFLIVGMFMDIISATLILGPVFIPMLYSFNIDPMHFGLIMTVNLAIGYCTPPMGVSLFITSALARRDFLFVSRAVMPFLIIQLIVLLIITYFPSVSLFLPKILGFVH
ncbi:TRAP transporter large permease subunit [Desulfothermus okinawensis JCM 13304]